MNDMDKGYRVALAELSELKNQSSSDIKKEFDNTSNVASEEYEVLKENIVKLESESAAEKEILEDKINLLEQELEESTNNGLEMHKMVEELLMSQKDSSAFQESVDNLQTMLDNQREKVGDLTSQLSLKSRLNDELNLELKSAKDKSNKLEYQIEQLSHSLEDVNKNKLEVALKLEEASSSIKQLQQVNEELTLHTSQTTSQVDSLNEEVDRLTQTIKSQSETLYTKEAELQVCFLYFLLKIYFYLTFYLQCGINLMLLISR